MEANSAFMLILGLLILYFGGHALFAKVVAISQSILSNAHRVELNIANVHHFVMEGVVMLAGILGAILLGLMLLGVLAGYAQVGFLFTFEPIKPKWEKLNPLNGIKKIFISKRSVVELLKGLLKLTIVGVVAYKSLQGVIAESIMIMDSDAGSILGFMVSSAFSVTMKTGLAFLVIAFLDYLFQRYQHQQELKMTKEEVKEETKMTEGDPLIKSRIRSIQRDVARRRMMQEVPKADVVITNPTHIAVALKYDMATMSAPKVVAKGAEKLAEKIRTLALENSVPVLEDKPLAWALYKSVEVNETIPADLFQAVAQTLAYIYQLKGIKPTFS